MRDILYQNVSRQITLVIENKGYYFHNLRKRAELLAV